MRHSDRRSWLLPLFVLLAVSGLGGPGEGQERELPKSLLEVTKAWQDSGRAWAELPEEARRARGTEFMQAYTFEDVHGICRGGGGDREAAEGSLEGFLSAKLTLAPLPAAELAVLLEDLSLRMPCHKAIVRHLAKTRDTYGEMEREWLGDALLSLIDESGYEVGIRSQLEAAAVEFSARDELLERMRTYSSSVDENVRLHGVRLMSLSCDPRAEQLMMETVERFAERGEVPPGRMLTLFGKHLGPKVFDLLVGFQSKLQGERERYDALQAIVYTGDPRALGQLLAAYNDQSTGILNRTFELQDRDERRRHFLLWHLCRVLEPAVIEALTGDREDLRLQAIEILDRESRYGIAEDMEGVLESLRETASRTDIEEGLADRLRSIVRRFESRQVEKDARDSR